MSRTWWRRAIRASGGIGKATFTDLSGNVEIRVFTITGRHVITLISGGAVQVDWDLINGGGVPVASGIYLWLITDSQGHQKIGRLAVIR